MPSSSLLQLSAACGGRENLPFCRASTSASCKAQRHNRHHILDDCKVHMPAKSKAASGFIHPDRSAACTWLKHCLPYTGTIHCQLQRDKERRQRSQVLELPQTYPVGQKQCWSLWKHGPVMLAEHTAHAQKHSDYAFFGSDRKQRARGDIPVEGVPFVVRTRYDSAWQDRLCAESTLITGTKSYREQSYRISVRVVEGSPGY